jgi:hypothetical protein
MLRNIPNKVNQAELKQILDQSSFGKFDFAYLRIDFSNDCKYVVTQKPYMQTLIQNLVLVMHLSILLM